MYTQHMKWSQIQKFLNEFDLLLIRRDIQCGNRFKFVSYTITKLSIKIQKYVYGFKRCLVGFFQIINRIGVFTIFATISLISVLTEFIGHDFRFDSNHYLKEGRKYFFWWWSQSSEDFKIFPPFLNYLLITFTLIIKVFWALKDYNNIVYSLVGMLVLWITSLDFQQFVRKEYHLRKQFELTRCNKKSIYFYRKLARLSRAFSRVIGFPLFLYLLFSILFYASVLGDILKTEATGWKFNMSTQVGFCLAIFGLSADFHRNVR